MGGENIVHEAVATGQRPETRDQRSESSEQRTV